MPETFEDLKKELKIGECIEMNLDFEGKKFDSMMSICRVGENAFHGKIKMGDAQEDFDLGIRKIKL